jgi:hypothetical protein
MVVASFAFTRKRRIAFACPLEHLKRLFEIAPGGAFSEILFCAQRRHLLRDGDVDELVHGHAFGFRDLLRLLH